MLILHSSINRYANETNEFRFCIVHENSKPIRGGHLMVSWYQRGFPALKGAAIWWPIQSIRFDKHPHPLIMKEIIGFNMILTRRHVIQTSAFWKNSLVFAIQKFKPGVAIGFRRSGSLLPFALRWTSGHQDKSFGRPRLRYWGSRVARFPQYSCSSFRAWRRKIPSKTPQSRKTEGKRIHRALAEIRIKVIG